MDNEFRRIFLKFIVLKIIKDQTHPRLRNHPDHRAALQRALDAERRIDLSDSGGPGE